MKNRLWWKWKNVSFDRRIFIIKFPHIGNGIRYAILANLSILLLLLLRLWFFCYCSGNLNDNGRILKWIWKRNVKLDIEMRDMNIVFWWFVTAYTKGTAKSCYWTVKQMWKKKTKNVVIHFGNDDLTNLTKAFFQFCWLSYVNLRASICFESMLTFAF